MAKKKKKVAKKKAGRPKKQFTVTQIEEIGEFAYKGCQTETIATLMDIPASTLRDNFRGLLTKKRAERKVWLRELQMSRAKSDASSAMAIFLGKNVLEQKDKTEHAITGKDGESLQLAVTVTKTYKKDGTDKL